MDDSISPIHSPSPNISPISPLPARFHRTGSPFSTDSEPEPGQGPLPPEYEEDWAPPPTYEEALMQTLEMEPVAQAPRDLTDIDVVIASAQTLGSQVDYVKTYIDLITTMRG